MLTAGLVNIRQDTWITTKCITGFIHEYLPLISDYSQVLSTRQNSLVSIYHLSVITCEYKSAHQELLCSESFNLSVITREHCISRVALTQHMGYLVNLDMSCTVNVLRLYNYKYTTQLELQNNAV